MNKASVPSHPSRQDAQSCQVNPHPGGSGHVDGQWFLVHTKPRQESIALENLERQGYECYLPLMRAERVRRGRFLVVQEPMFARYLFICLQTHMAAKSWTPIRSTLGVHQLVRFGAQPASVPVGLIEALRQAEETSDTEALFEAGDEVLILKGPFAGLHAVFQATDLSDGERRSHLLLELLGKSVRLAVGAADIQKAA